MPAKKKKPAKKTTAKRSINPGFAKPLRPSAALAEIVGSKPLARFEVASKIWDYIRKHDLQDKKNRRQINPDEKLAGVLGKKPLSMFELTKAYNKHLSD